MDLHLKAGEHLRITHDHVAVGFLLYMEGNILHLRAKAGDDPNPRTEVVLPDLIATASANRQPPRRAT